MGRRKWVREGSQGCNQGACIRAGGGGGSEPHCLMGLGWLSLKTPSGLAGPGLYGRGGLDSSPPSPAPSVASRTGVKVFMLGVGVWGNVSCHTMRAQPSYSCWGLEGESAQVWEEHGSDPLQPQQPQMLSARVQGRLWLQEAWQITPTPHRIILPGASWLCSVLSHPSRKHPL